MPLDDTLKAFSLADADIVDKLFAFENLDQNSVANLHRASIRAIAVGLKRHFAHELHWRKIVLRQVPAGGFGQARLLHKLDQAYLSRFVSVLDRKLVLRNHTRTSLQH